MEAPFVSPDFYREFYRINRHGVARISLRTDCMAPSGSSGASVAVGEACRSRHTIDWFGSAQAAEVARRTAAA
jgi:hypothetical protein